MKIREAIILGVLLPLAIQTSCQSIVISELMAANKKNISDGFGESDDWIELYNAGDSSIDIGNFFLTDNINNPTKHQIPATKPYWTTIESHQRIILWVDGDDEQGTRHLNFNLAQKGGFIAIFDSDTNLIDQLNYPLQYSDISYGREQDASNQMCFFPIPTGGSPNVGGSRINDPAVFPEFSISSGFYDSSITISLSCSYEGSIYYSTDGKEPTIEQGILYDSPIKIDSTTVLRATLIRKGYFAGTIVTQSYFINENPSIPVVSLTADPKDLWDKKQGIYYKYKRKGWERQGNVEYFDLSDSGALYPAFNNAINMRISGKTSRRQPKKSFALFTDDAYGHSRINYQIFKDKDIHSFGSIGIRSDATSGRNVPDLWVGERFKNELLYEVNKEMGSTVGMQAYQPVLLFLNGKYWGLYNLMERKGADFIENNFGFANVDIMTGENETVVRGNSRRYDELTTFILKNPSLNDSIYAKLCTMMNMECYIDYWIYEVYSSTHDNQVNIRYWRPKGPSQKWEWISYDQDSWHTYDENSISRFAEGDEVFLFSLLLESEHFRKDFANRMCDYLNTTLQSDNVIRLVNQITNHIALEVPREKERWQDTMLYIPSNQRVDWIMEYAVQRPCNIRSHIMTHYGLEGGEAEITLKGNENGDIQINSITIKKYPWKGYYLENIPISLQAIPKPGYKFVGWSDKSYPKEEHIEIMPKPGMQIEPKFKKQRNIK